MNDYKYGSMEGYSGDELELEQEYNDAQELRNQERTARTIHYYLNKEAE